MTIEKFRALVFCVGAFFVLCDVNSASNLGVEKISITQQMKEHIMQSPFKATLQRSDGKKIVAYLYADDEQTDVMDYYSCIDGEPKHSAIKTGHFYIYLYDVNASSFLQTRKEIFHGFDGVRLNGQGADLIVLSGVKTKQSDVLLVSQFGDCNGNFFEAYGFSKNNLYLKNYTFITKQKQTQFYGRIGAHAVRGKQVAYGLYDNHHYEVQQMTISLSNKPEEIQLKTVYKE